MTKPKHTPGPWKHDDIYGLIVTQDGAEIAACHAGRTGGKSETVPNARLIAAAPELLEALKQLLDDYSDATDCCDPNCDCEGNDSKKRLAKLATAAIAKAEGKE